ncbi:MAG: hypothetical protein Ct9H300mP28_30890 [Pseudomonadota bacterium]|nr:MAG: hypothetical protein Ct9H300mP28_30890 [Pseudomonadota bacterium]
MFYREAGQFKTTYIADQELFPVKQDRGGIFILIGFSFIVIPLIAMTIGSGHSDSISYFFISSSWTKPLTGYAGQLSLGQGASWQSVLIHVTN